MNELQKLSDPQRIRLAQFIATRCFLVIVSTPSFESAYRLFSVLNTRGLDLYPTDVLKAEIIGKILPEQREKYGKDWENTEDDLGRERFNELFTHVRMIHQKAKLSQTIVTEFEKHILPKYKPTEFVKKVLNPYADAFAIITGAAYQSKQRRAEEVNTLLRWLNRIDNSDWIPPAILYFADDQNDPDKLVRFLCELERLAAGLMIMRRNVNRRIERYARLLTSIEQRGDVYAPNSPLQLQPTECHEIKQKLNGLLYLETRIRLYVLLRLDSELSQSQASYAYPTTTVEHVLPQNPPSSSTWTTWFPDIIKRFNYTHCMGNLVLLSRRKNAEAQNFDFETKKRKYFSSPKGVANFALTTQVLREREWTPDVVERRQQELLSILTKLWRL